MGQPVADISDKVRRIGGFAHLTEKNGILSYRYMYMHKFFDRLDKKGFKHYIKFSKFCINFWGKEGERKAVLNLVD